MKIREMSRAECLGALARGRLARLGCARDNQPYVVPIYYAFHKTPDGDYVYGFTTVGQKVEWMRANPRVCVEWDEVTRHDRWVSVIAFGRYEELPDPAAGEPAGIPARPFVRAAVPEPSEEDRERRRAYELLQQHTTWWEPGAAAYAASGHRDRTQPFPAVYYRIRIDEVTGHQASPDPTANAGPGTSGSHPRSEGWVRKVLRRLAGRCSGS
ncbi:MAG: pyridoxamine 5'-phosphate oxidase family protein [Zavarzinella sp.]|nr:pyridoxamine 5'-phosphate oxidase family protein [Zavarzinella sp.]